MTLLTRNMHLGTTFAHIGRKRHFEGTDLNHKFSARTGADERQTTSFQFPANRIGKGFVPATPPRFHANGEQCQKSAALGPYLLFSHNKNLPVFDAYQIGRQSPAWIRHAFPRSHVEFQ